MIYELHITVDHNDPDFYLESWVAACEQWDAKPLDIRLAEGKHTRQVMFAIVHQGDDMTAHDWVYRMLRKVHDAGFVILRQKLEVPLDKSASYLRPPYHEAHIKCLIPADESAHAVDRLCNAGWVASYNDLFRDDAGMEKWYFTWRAYGVDFKWAARAFADQFADLSDVCWHAVRMESETVLQDTNPDLDEGWA